MNQQEIKQLIKKCKIYKKRIKEFYKKLDHQYSSNLITKEQYQYYLSKYLKNKTKKEWLDYYDNQIYNLRSKLSTKLPIQHRLIIILAIIVFSSIALYYNQYTGYVTLDNVVIKQLNLEFKENNEYSLSLDNIPSYVRLTGSVIGDGSFKVYLVSNNNKYLIVDDSILKKPVKITGFAPAIGKGKKDTTILETTTTLETATILETTTTLEFPTLLPTTTLEPTITIPETTIIEVTTTLLEKLKSFNNECIETCNLVDVGNDIKLIIEVNNIMLRLDSLSYKGLVKKKEVVKDVINVKNLEGTAYYNLTKSIDGDYLKIYSSKNEPRSSIKINKIKDLKKLDIYIDKAKEEKIKTDVIGINESLLFSNATITLNKYGNVKTIFKCNNFNFNDFTCNNWISTNINFTSNNNSISFIIHNFSAYGGGEDIFTTQVDTTKPLYSNNQTNITNPLRNKPVKHSIKWTDETALSINRFETNITSIARNYSTTLSGTSQWVNITNITSYQIYRYYWKSYTNDSSNNWNSSRRMFVNVTNNIPTSSTPILNATDHPYNTTAANLTAYNKSFSDADNDALTSIHTWYKNSKPYSQLELTFDKYEVSRLKGKIQDYSSWHNNFQLGEGAAARVPTWISNGKRGGAYKFDGNDDSIGGNTNSSLLLNLTTQFSIELWINPAINLSKMDQWAIFARRFAGGTPQKGWYFGLDSTKTKFDFSVANGTTTKQCASAVKLNTNQWYHVTATFNATHQSIYLNGTIYKNCTTNTKQLRSTLASTTFVIGGTGTSFNFNGSIDEVLFYNYTLSAAEIYTHFNLDYDKIVSQETSINDIWKVGITPNDAAQDGIQQNSTTLTILTDTTKPTYSGNQTNTTSPNLNQYVRHSIKWTDNAALSKNRFETNITGTIKNYTSSLSGTSQWVNTTNKTSSNIGKYYWKSYSNDSSNNWNFTNKMLINVLDTTKPLFYYNSTNNTNPKRNTNIKFNINWTDNIRAAYNIFETNITGTIKNHTTSINAKSSNINITNKTSSNTGVFYWKSYSNDTSNNWNFTNKMFLKVTGPVIVTGCGTLSTNNTVYELSKNLSTTTDCITIKARDIIFDCRNSTHPNTKNWIDGDGGSLDDAFTTATTYGFNTTIRNCIITDLTGVREASGPGAILNRKLLFYNNDVRPSGDQDGYVTGTRYRGNVNISSIYNNTFNLNSSSGRGIVNSGSVNDRNITNNDIWARKGIIVSGTYSYITNNRIYLSGAGAASWGYGIQFGANHQKNISNNYVVFLQPSSLYYFAYHITPISDAHLNITSLNQNNTAGDRNKRDKFYYIYKETNPANCIIKNINFTNYPISNFGKIVLIDSNYCRLTNLTAGSPGYSNLYGGFLTNYNSNHTFINNNIFRINYNSSGGSSSAGSLGSDINRYISDGILLSGSNNVTITNLTLTGSRLSTAGTNNIIITADGIGYTQDHYYNSNYVFKNISVVNCKDCLLLGGFNSINYYKDNNIKIFDSNFSNALNSVINGTFYKDVYFYNTIFDKSISNYFNVINLDGYNNLTIKNSNITNNYRLSSNLLKLGKTSSNLTNVKIINNRFRNATSNSIYFESGNNTNKFMGKGILNISNNIMNNSKTTSGVGAYGIYLNNYYGKAYIQNNDILNGETSSDKQSYSLIYLTGQHNYTEIKDNYLYNANRFFYSNSYINNTNLSNNIFEKPIYIGVEPRGNNFVFKNNKFYIKEVLSAWTTGFYVDDATTNNIKIEQNHFNNTAGVNLYGFNIAKNNITLKYNYCYGANWCITSTYKKNISYINNYLWDTYVGIEVPSTGNVTIRNATIHLNPGGSYTDGKCLYVYNYAGDRYSNLSIYNMNCTASNTQYSIYADTYGRIYVYNSSLDDGILYFSSSKNNVFLNTTYKNNQQQLTSSNITVKWYLQVNVTNNTNLINNALVNVSDKNKLYQTKNTSSNGLTNFFTVTSMILGSNNKDYNNFWINVSKPLYTSNSTRLNITSSQLRKLYIKISNNLPTISSFNMLDDDASTGYQIDPITGYPRFFYAWFNVTDPDGISDIRDSWIKIWNSTSSENNPTYSNYSNKSRCIGNTCRHNFTLRIDYWQQSGYVWNITYYVNDSSSVTVKSTTNFSVSQNSAFSLRNTPIFFGQLIPSNINKTAQVSYGYPMQTNNTGNVQLTMRLRSIRSNLTGWSDKTKYIGLANITYDNNTQFSSESKLNNSLTTYTSLLRKTLNSIYWAIDVPNNTKAQQYNTTLEIANA